MLNLNNFFLVIILLFSKHHLGAQELYLWNAVTENGITSRSSIPLYYDMYKLNLSDHGLSRLFTINTSEFEHPNMSGEAFFITAFTISKDLETIYFLEDEGDLYRFGVESRELNYVQDLTPLNSDPQYNYRNISDQIEFVDDNTLFVSGKIQGLYNLSTSEFVRIDDCPEPCHEDVNSKSTVFFENHMYSVNYNNMLIKYDINDPYNFTTLLSTGHTNNLGSFRFGYLFGKYIPCEDPVIKYLDYTPNDNPINDSIYIFNINLENNELELIQDFEGFSNNFLPNKNNLMDVQHFDLPIIEECDSIAIYIPNIISKNPTDSQNGFFSIQGPISLEYDIFIFDRWGNEVYKKRKSILNKTEDFWRPTAKHSSGVYPYLIEYLDHNESKTISGTVTVIE